MPFSPGTPGVKSVQTVTVTFLSANTSQNVTIASVNPSKSILYMAGGISNFASGSYDYSQVLCIQGYISAATTVNIQRRSNSLDVDCIFTVVEYY